MNARHKENVKAHDLYISIYENENNICHSTYERACTATNYIKEVSMSLVEEISK